MVAKKRASKRQTLQTKYKIVKRTQQHHRRLKKGATLQSGRKKSEAMSIPNSWPYKEDLLKEVRAAKERMEELRVRQKEKRQEEVVSYQHLSYLETTHIHTYSALHACIISYPSLAYASC